ncbi:MAG TPA: hypothetical protein VMW35_09805 [Myxococcota bacterium]|jgi:hypothetical protein|nr:hypothetical protein [Myxococcota bacterium]
MAQEHFGHLKLDRRLARRRNWITSKELETELAKLPDVSDKAVTPDQEGESTEGNPSGQPA